MQAYESERLRIRPFDFRDADFILRLLNEPSFIANIADKGVRDREGACAYLANGPMTSYRERSFGLAMVERRSDGAALGMCGLIKRDALDDVDIGYAFLPEFTGQGYAFEAARRTLADARERLSLQRVVAVVNPDNAASRRLLEKLGFALEKPIALHSETPDVLLYGLAL